MSLKKVHSCIVYAWCPVTIYFLGIFCHCKNSCDIQMTSEARFYLKLLYAVVSYFWENFSKMGKAFLLFLTLVRLWYDIHFVTKRSNA